MELPPHCCICIPGRACVERFVTCMRPPHTKHNRFPKPSNVGNRNGLALCTQVRLKLFIAQARAALESPFRFTKIGAFGATSVAFTRPWRSGTVNVVGLVWFGLVCPGVGAADRGRCALSPFYVLLPAPTLHKTRAAEPVNNPLTAPWNISSQRTLPIRPPPAPRSIVLETDQGRCRLPLGAVIVVSLDDDSKREYKLLHGTLEVRDSCCEWEETRA